jgi:hypothetical protein
MTPLRAGELYRDFVHGRQFEAFGWPDANLYKAEDMRYFRMLERERLAGRLAIQGPITTKADILKLEAELFG